MGGQELWPGLASGLLVVCLFSSTQEQILDWGYRFELISIWIAFDTKVNRRDCQGREFKTLGTWAFKERTKEQEPMKLNEKSKPWKENERGIPLSFIDVSLGPVPPSIPIGTPKEVMGRDCL